MKDFFFQIIYIMKAKHGLKEASHIVSFVTSKFPQNNKIKQQFRIAV